MNKHFHFLLLLLMLSNSKAFAVKGNISVGCNLGFGCSFLLGPSSKKESTTASIRVTDFKRIFHPNLHYGVTIGYDKSLTKKVKVYLEGNLYLQNQYLENQWNAYDSATTLIYSKKAYYRMFECNFSITGGVDIKHVILGVSIDNIFTLANYTRTDLFYQNKDYINSFYDKRNQKESTWFYKIDIGAKLGYQIPIKKKIDIQTYVSYSFGVFHHYDTPIAYWGLSKSGRIDNLRIGIIIKGNLKQKK